MRFAILLLAVSAYAQPPAAPTPPSTIEERTKGMQKLDGYFPLYWDERAGTLFLDIPTFAKDKGGKAAGPTGFGNGLFSGTVASVTPTPDSVTLREHYSFVELPDSHYTPRYYDPRAGYFGPSYVDYSVPIGEPIVKRF